MVLFESKSVRTLVRGRLVLLVVGGSNYGLRMLYAYHYVCVFLLCVHGLHSVYIQIYLVKRLCVYMVLGIHCVWVWYVWVCVYHTCVSSVHHCICRVHMCMLWRLVGETLG